MGLAGIELRYLIDAISARTAEYYVSNVYGITRDSILFKLHHPEKPDIFLMITTFGIWITEMRIDQVEPHRMTRRLRSDLLRLRVTGVQQVGTERIAYVRFGGRDGEFVLVAEFFGGGNIILCSKEMKVLALQRRLEVRHRTLTVGSTYSPPPQDALDIYVLPPDAAGAMGESEHTCGRWIGRNLGLPARYVEEICRRAQVDSSAPGARLAPERRQAVLDAARELAAQVRDGRHDPVIIRSPKPEACPIRVGDAETLEPVPSFDRGLDLVFTEKIVKEARQSGTETESRRIAQLEKRLSEQDGAMDLVRRRADAISAVAREIFAVPALSIRDELAAAALERAGARFTREKGRAVIRVLDEKIRIDPDSPLPAIASALYDEAKVQSGAIPDIRKQRRKTERELELLKGRELKLRESIGYENIRKKSWFERYRWFYTSDGRLAVGGRDTSSNSSIVRKHLEDGDRVFHADIFGSPFFVLKGGLDAGLAAVSEVAQATVCFSRAWREAAYGVRSYWVNPPQVKRAAPSGQFLPRGSFSIEGHRNFVRVASLKLGVGLMERDGEFLLECGPQGAVRQNARWYVTIEPGSSDAADVAKRIRSEMISRAGEVAARYSVDDFLRALPAGKSRLEGSSNR